MRRLLFGLLAIGGVIGCVVVANLSRSPSAYNIDWRVIAQAAKEVHVEEPVRGEIVQTLVAPGKLKAIEEANVASQIIGRVVAVKNRGGKEVKKGDEVKKDDLLVKLEDKDATSRLNSILARADRLRESLKSAQADLEKAIRDRKLSLQLVDKGVITETELKDHETTVAKMEASLKMLQHELTEMDALRQTAQEDLRRTEIVAPINGVVVDRNVEVGEIVIAGTINLPGSVLMKIADLSQMEVEAEVDETDVLLVQPKQPAKIYLQADQRAPIRGVVERIAGKGTKVGEAVSFETLIAIPPRQANLRTGMTATVEIEVRRAKNALSVPVQAVVHRRRKDLPDVPLFREFAQRQARLPGEKNRQSEARYLKILFVLDGESVRARPVETGLSDERRIEIVSGLQEGEQVVVGPFRVLDELKDGQTVSVVEPTAEGAP